MLRTRHTALAALALCVSAGIAAPARAAEFLVTTTLDAPDANPGNGVCAATGGACTLRAAVMEASAVVGDDTLFLPPGEFVLTLAGDGPEAGDLDVLGGLSIEGSGALVTVIDGAAQDRIFEVASSATQLALRDVTLRNGSAPAALPLGGAISASAPLVLADCVIESSTANAGGAIFTTTSASLLAERCTFRDNQTAPLGFTNQDGGALVIQGGALLDGCTLSGNRSPSGAAIFANSSLGSTQLVNTTVSGNLGGETISLQNASAVLRHVTLAGNEGRGIGTFSFGSVHALAIENSVIADNGGGDCSFPPTNGPVVSRAGNNLSSDASCGFTAPGSFENTAPALAPLADNGGTTLTRAPLPASPLRDAAATAQCTPTDQVGALRPIDGNGDLVALCDIGALEAPEPGSAVSALAALIAVLARLRRARTAR